MGNMIAESMIETGLSEVIRIMKLVISNHLRQYFILMLFCEREEEFIKVLH